MRYKILYLYVFVYLFLLPCYTINHVARKNVKNMFSIFRVISIIIHFMSQSLEKQPGFETSLCVSRPSIKMN